MTSTMVEAWQLLKGADFAGKVNSCTKGPSIVVEFSLQKRKQKEEKEEEEIDI